jgi:hypothetical protein
MVRQHVFEKKLLTKFTENINSLELEYFALIARDHPLQIPKKGTWIMSEDEYVQLLSKQWGGIKVHDEDNIHDKWVESRKKCDRDATPAWNELLQKYPDGKASGQDTEWTQRALTHLWYERDCLTSKDKKINRRPRPKTTTTGASMPLKTCIDSYTVQIANGAKILSFTHESGWPLCGWAHRLKSLERT